MKPSDCKTKPQAVAAAGAVFEARLRLALHLTETGKVNDFPLDDKLYELEHAYWKRADELASLAPQLEAYERFVSAVEECARMESNGMAYRNRVTQLRRELSAGRDGGRA